MFRIRAGVAAAATLGALIAPAVTTNGASAAVFHGTRIAGPSIGNLGWTSSNWSGYAKTGSFTSTTGRWKVPSVAATAQATFSSTWVGIDGFNNSNLIQAGTSEHYYNGAAHYYAWWEILPAPETQITSLTVRPGDTMTVSIKRGSGGVWTIVVKDVTTGKSFSTQQAYSGPGSSVEWIQEAPTVNGSIATLAHYKTFAFDPGTANGTNPKLASSNAGAMIQKNKQVSTPSSPDSDTDGFRVAHSATAPSPPSS